MTPGNLAILFTLFDRVFDPVIRKQMHVHAERRAKLENFRSAYISSQCPRTIKFTVLTRIAEVRKNNCCRGINNDFSRPHIFLASVDAGCSHVLRLLPGSFRCQIWTLPPLGVTQIVATPLRAGRQISPMLRFHEHAGI